MRVARSPRVISCSKSRTCGEKVWPRLGAPIRSVAAVRERQLIQHSVDELELRLVVARPLTAEEETRIRERLGSELRHPFVVRFTYVDALADRAGRKFEEVVSHLK